MTTDPQTVHQPNVRPGATSGLDADPELLQDSVQPPPAPDVPEGLQVTGTGGSPMDPPQPGADPDGFGGDAPEPEGVVHPIVLPEGLTGLDLDAWVSGDAVEGDETENPERYAAYQARLAAARAAGSGVYEPQPTNPDGSPIPTPDTVPDPDKADPPGTEAPAQ